ncbi:MAG: hypothetical protein M5U24_06430 [Candidatus Kuenenia sp.]|nr:hypothetical protein [Candidatus Kuenenia sp.]MCZ7622108.1 hypothetical protein [Candidatus Kuenenia sp.]
MTSFKEDLRVDHKKRKESGSWDVYVIARKIVVATLYQLDL